MTMRMGYRIAPKSIHDTIKIINLVRDTTFSFQEKFMEDRYKQIFRRAFAGTMVATGETRSKLFNRKRVASSNHVHFSCGYDSTSNNQSFKQEFERGPVHTGVKEHFRDEGKVAKCSRRPVDIYSMFGQKYRANKAARRRALAKSISAALGTSVGNSAAVVGNTLMYQPDLGLVVDKMRIITRSIARLGGA